MHRRLVLALAAAGGFAAAGLLLAQKADSHLPETQKLILENDFVRVWDIHVPPGVFEAKHSHARGITIALSDYDNMTKSLPEGKVSSGHTKFGEVKWAEPVTHEATNTGSTEQHVIRIELKKDAPSGAQPEPAALDSLVVCHDTQKLLFENQFVRAIENHSPAGSVEAKHAHPHGLSIALSDYDSETTTLPGGQPSRRHTSFGEVHWSEAVVHQVRNVGSTEQHVIRIELK